jgi:hypothetical protein
MKRQLTEKRNAKANRYKKPCGNLNYYFSTILAIIKEFGHVQY